MGEKKFLYYVLGLTLIIVLIIAYFYIYPEVNKINNAKKNLATKQVTLTSLEQKETKLKQLSRDYDKYRDKIDIITGLFPSTKEISDYLTQLEGLSLKSNIRILSVKIASQQQSGKSKVIAPDKTQLIKEGNMYKLPLDVQVVANNYSDTISFIANLEKISRFTTIDKIAIKERLENGRNLIETTFSSFIYVK